jgi:hypothetical protein
MAATATGIVLTAGTLTFANEWYQAHSVDWKIPVATLFAAAIFDGLEQIDSKAAIGLSVIILVGAVTTRVNGKSVADTVNELFSAQKKVPPKRAHAV